MVRRLPVLICLLALSALATAGAASARPPVRAVDFEAAVPSGGAHAARAGWVVSPVQRERTFDLVGFRWRGSAGKVAVRVRRPSGWSAWLALDAEGTRRGQTLGEPAWTGGADAYQLRTSRAVTGIRAHFVTVTGDRARLPARAADVSSSPGAPPIIPRSEWDPSNQCPPRVVPSYGRVDMAFVHDTVSSNDYAPTDSAAMVLAICRFHRNSNGWNDIGYNFLVDKYGQVFEGRAGGVDQPVIGAQAQGYNTVSTGVANLGSFDSVPQTEAGIQALSKLIGWRLHLAGVPEIGTLTEISGGGEDNRYSAGTPVTLNRIAGHRDGDATDCPGNSLYAQLPEIRNLAAQYAATLAPVPRVTGLPGRTTVRFPSATAVTGTLSVPDEPSPGGQVVSLERRAGAAWVATGLQATTGADGAWSVLLHGAWTHTYRAYWGGDATHVAIGGSPFTVSVLPKLAVAVKSTHVHLGRSAVLTGTVAPVKPHLLVAVARRSRGAYQAAGRVAGTTKRGTFRIVVRLRKAGLYRLTVASVADRNNPSAHAASVYVRVG